MKHDIDFYMKSDTKTMRAISIVLMVVGCFGMLLTPGAALMLMAGIINLIMIETCVSKSWTFDELEYETWTQYRALPAEYQKTIGLGPATMASFNATQWRELKSKVSTINDNLSAMAQYASLPDDVGASIDMIIERDRNELSIRRQVHKELG